jgi:hypothetical protein
MLSINSDTGVIGFIFKSFHAMSPASIAKSLTDSMLSASNIAMIKCSGSKWSMIAPLRYAFLLTREFASIQLQQLHEMPYLLEDKYLVDASL